MSAEPLSSVRARLHATAIERGGDPRDVDTLLADAAGRSVPFIIAHGELPVDAAPLVEKLERRWRGEPLQYIRNRADFYGREFYVDDRVLIPRPETELLVEAALDLAPDGGRVIDIGAGSGAIAISMRMERPDLSVTAVDVSLAALAVTALNCRRHASRVALAVSDLLTSIHGQFDLILSNPPYIPAADIASLQIEVRGHEPRMALTPGPAGTEAIDGILRHSPPHLVRGGRVVIEIGIGQESAVRALAARHGFDVERVIPDLAGIPRTVVLSAHGE